MGSTQIEKLAYEIYLIRMERNIAKSAQWDWVMAELYIVTECDDPIEKWLRHFI